MSSEASAVFGSSTDDGGPSPSDGEDPLRDPEFVEAFNDKPNKYSDKALALFITFKIFHEQKKKATAETIHAAFKRLWKTADGDKYRGKWHFDERQACWAGNPADSAEVADVMEAVKHKCGAEGGDRTHSLAMSKDFMDRMFGWSFRESPTCSDLPCDLATQAIRTKHSEFRAFSSLGWTLWTRNFELVKLKRRHIKFNLEDELCFNQRYDEIHLVDRKGWQRKLNNEPDLRANRYRVYDQPSMGACDARKWLHEWVGYLETAIYKRPLEPDDYIFPTMGANGVVQPGEHVTHDIVQKWINEFTSNARLCEGQGGNFSTHCFRRGGAQYRFMFAPVGQRWTLKRVRWWGGWAEGEHRDTLLRYLLDELHSYEEDYGDSLRPIQRDNELTLMGEGQLTAPVSTEALQLYHRSLSAEMRDIRTGMQDLSQLFLSTSLSSVPSRPAAQLRSQTTSRIPGHVPRLDTRPLIPINLHPGSHALRPPAPSHFHLNTPQPSLPTARHNEYVPSSTPSQATTAKSPRALPTHTEIIPDLPIWLSNGSRSHPRESWRLVVKHWEVGDPPRGLKTPLKDWPPSYLRGANRELFGQKYYLRRVIATEFIDQYRRDEDAFLAAYPQAEDGHTRLQTAIVDARKARGEITERKRKK
ncbi:hypothetical protein HGRIS_003117 [Hohenbuehelia grisea]|uniref:Uncharacterized protein n=1 Tax=Hohenbuehelia grisea TaxID=104357 RepID=A0ABR3JMS0_9AGAR